MRSFRLTILSIRAPTLRTAHPAEVIILRTAHSDSITDCRVSRFYLLKMDRANSHDASLVIQGLHPRLRNEVLDRSKPGVLVIYY